MKLVVGCGYLGERVARLWRDAGETVFVVTRSTARADALASDGYRPIVADVTDRTALSAISAAIPQLDTVLYAVGFDRAAGRAMREVYVDGLRNVLDALPAETRRMIYISSTGVYAQNDGSWIDEQSPCEPTREGGQVCLAAEQLLSQHSLGERAIVLRLAGIYGPDRIPRAADLKAGKPVTASPDGYLNLIHVDDAARIVLAVEQHFSESRRDSATTMPQTYLVSDGQPVLRRDYYSYVSQLLGAPVPTFAPAESPEFSARRGNTDKRVSNAKLCSEIQYKFEYPSYREGLAAIVGKQRNQ